MVTLFDSSFSLKVDTSECTSLLTGCDPKLNDTWYYSDQVFESGKIYGLVSEYGQGCTYLSYLIGGRLDFDMVRMYCGDNEICREDLLNVSWNLEAYIEPYGKKRVRKSIESALKEHPDKGDFLSIAERFLLTSPRYDRQFRYLSGERWRASAALGYSLNKRIFYAPYKSSMFYYQVCQEGLLKVLRELTSYGALVLLPTGSDEFIKHIADEVLYLNRKFDIDSLRQIYIRRFNEDMIK